jgi:Uma2 family endonuclease
MPDDVRCEIIEGELLMTPAPNARHQLILSNLLFALMAHVKSGNLGKVLPAPTDVVLAQDQVVQPDILFITRERQQIIDLLGAVHGAPDLAVEILSPATTGRDKVMKRKLYGRHGVREYWIVDPATGTVEVLVPDASDLETWRMFQLGQELMSPLLPGLVIPLSEVFAE